MSNVDFLKDMQLATNESARHVRTVYTFFLLMLFYIAVIVFSTSDEQLFKTSDITLPLLNVGLPLLGFYVIVPWLIIVLHLNLLIQFFLLSSKLSACETAAEESPDTLESKYLNEYIFPLIFCHMLIKKPRNFFMLRLFKVLMWISVIVFPLLVLISMQVRFLSYQSFWITLNHNLVIVFDLAMIWALWIFILYGHQSIPGTRRLLSVVLNSPGFNRSALCTLLVLFFTLFIAIVPGTGVERITGPIPALDKILHRNLELTRMTLLEKEPPPELIAAYYSVPVSPVASTVVTTRKVGNTTMQQTHTGQTKSTPTISRQAIQEVWLKYSKPLNLENRSLIGANFKGSRLVKANFEGANLTRANLENADLRGASFIHANLDGAVLKDAELSAAVFENANFSNTRIESIQFSELDLKGADFSETTLVNVNFSKANLENARFNQSVIDNIYFNVANLRNADFSESEIKNSSFKGAELNHARFERTKFADLKIDDANLQYAVFNDAENIEKYQLYKTHNWVLAFFDEAGLRKLNLPDDHNDRIKRKDLKGYNLEGVNLSYADLSGADLRGCRLNKSIMKGTNFQGADLRDLDWTKVEESSSTNFEKANLSGGNFNHCKPYAKSFNGADLSRVSFEGAYLSSGDFRKANLTGTNLTGADLSWADLSGAIFNNTNLNGAVMSGTKIRHTNLEGVVLSGSEMRSADLEGSNCKNANLENANLQDAKLEVTELTGANLKDTNLKKANLTGCNFESAELNGADLTGADLRLVVLTKANLSNTKLSDCKNFELALNVTSANLYNADVSKDMLKSLMDKGALWAPPVP